MWWRLRLAFAVAVVQLLLQCYAAELVLLNVTTMNVLAPTWLSGYPSACPELRDTFMRQQRALAFLSEHFSGADIIALQETERTTMPLLRRGLEVLGFDVYFADHRDSYWGDRAMRPFYSNGVAVAMNRQRFRNCTVTPVALGTAGNRAVRRVYMATLRNRPPMSLPVLECADRCELQPHCVTAPCECRQCAPGHGVDAAEGGGEVTRGAVQQHGSRRGHHRWCVCRCVRPLCMRVSRCMLLCVWCWSCTRNAPARCADSLYMPL
jgi:hypothetical protein